MSTHNEIILIVHDPIMNGIHELSMDIHVQLSISIGILFKIYGCP